LCGRHGQVFPQGRNQLAVEAFDGRVARRLRQALGWRALYVRGESYWCYVFHPDWLRTVAAIVRPRRLRRVSAAAK
jgi:hypothetical protein